VEVMDAAERYHGRFLASIKEEVERIENLVIEKCGNTSIEIIDAKILNWILNTKFS